MELRVGKKVSVFLCRAGLGWAVLLAPHPAECASCLDLSCLVLSCLVLSCLILPYLISSCLVSSRLVLSCSIG